jgi:hypothetical protein
MTRFRRREATQPIPEESFGTMTLSETNMLDDDDDDEPESAKSSMFERRARRRRNRNKEDSKGEKKKSSSKKKLVDKDVDPYDSDPGESYRQHCLRVKGLGSRTCMPMPRFLKNSASDDDEELEDTVMTAPPSPLSSELDDVLNQTPASLPPNMERVRYSLRTSIGDGSAKQPDGPTVMERRELRPNGVSLNVSHWSDMGRRPYMEDR